jgi:hypothetical protein
LRAQPGKIDPRHLDAPDLVSGFGRAFSTGVGQRLAEMSASRIGMALNNRDPL